MAIKYKGGIHIDSELKKYQEEAEKFRTIKRLTMDNMEMKSKIKSNAQEISKLLGITDKYKK